MVFELTISSGKKVLFFHASLIHELLSQSGDLTPDTGKSETLDDEERMPDTKNNNTTEVKDISYNPKAIEQKWQAKWEADKLYRSVIDERKPKHYALTMLPYPSGDLHIGHWYAMTPSDARARYMR